MRDYRKMIVSNPGVMTGKPVIAGTRITVELMKQAVFAGRATLAHPQYDASIARSSNAYASTATWLPMLPKCRPESWMKPS